MTMPAAQIWDFTDAIMAGRRLDAERATGERLCANGPANSIRLWANPAIYAIDAADDRVAGASRDGQILVFRVAQNGSGAVLKPVAGIRANLPVLSICCLPGQDACVSDSNGQLHYFHERHSKLSPFNRNAVDDPICDIALLDQNQVLALAASGALEVWNTRTSTGQTVVHAVPPAGPLAAARLVYWPAIECWLYPAMGGQWCGVHLESGTTHSSDAHHGDLTALCVQGDTMYTFGCDDGRGFKWRAGDNDPYDEFKHGLRPVAVGFLRPEDEVFLVLNKDGAAVEAELQGARLVARTRFPGNTFRALLTRPAISQPEPATTVPPPCEETNMALHSEYGNPPDPEEELRTRTAVVKERAREAVRGGDYVGEMKVLMEHLEAVLTPAPEDVELLKMYFDALRRAMLTDEAAETAWKLSECITHHGQDGASMLHRLWPRLRNQYPVAATCDLSLAEILTIANLLGKPVCGLLEPPDIEHQLPAFNGNLGETRPTKIWKTCRTALPSDVARDGYAKKLRARWIVQDEIPRERRMAILRHISMDASEPQPVLAVIVEAKGQFVSVEPRHYLLAPGPRQGVPVPTYHDDLLLAAASLNDTVERAWISKVWNHLFQALTKIKTTYEWQSENST